MKFRFIENHRSLFSVRKMCRFLTVSKSGFYDWLTRPESKRIAQNNKILEAIKKIHKIKNKDVYGSPRLLRDLKKMGFNCDRKRVARIMSRNGIKAKTCKKWKATTNSRHNLPVAKNLLNQNFSTDGPNKIWSSDITYIWTKQGWLYLCVILDVFSRKIVGWSMDKTMKKELVLNALNQAIKNRSPGKGLIFHSDRGAQYCSKAVRDLIDLMKFKQSMSKKGDCYDNAVTETFFHTLKTELVYLNNYTTRSAARLDIFEYIETFYNRERRHSTLGYLSPVKYEKIAYQKVA